MNDRKDLPAGFECSEEYFAKRVVDESELLEGEELVTAAFKLVDELYDKRDREEPPEESESFEDYAAFEAYVLKRMAKELGTDLEGEESIKATSRFLSKIQEEHKDYLEGVKERCIEMRDQISRKD